MNTNAIAGITSITSYLSTSTSFTFTSNNSYKITYNTVLIEARLGAALGIIIITVTGFTILWRLNAKRVKDLSRLLRPNGLIN
jgi:hypothetical protein